MVDAPPKPAHTLGADDALCLYPQAAGAANDGARQVKVVSTAAAQTAVDGKALSRRADLRSTATNTQHL